MLRYYETCHHDIVNSRCIYKYYQCPDQQRSSIWSSSGGKSAFVNQTILSSRSQPMSYTFTYSRTLKSPSTFRSHLCLVCDHPFSSQDRSAHTAPRKLISPSLSTPQASTTYLSIPPYPHLHVPALHYSHSSSHQTHFHTHPPKHTTHHHRHQNYSHHTSSKKPSPASRANDPHKYNVRNSSIRTYIRLGRGRCAGWFRGKCISMVGQIGLKKWKRVKYTRMSMGVLFVRRNPVRDLHVCARCHSAVEEF